MAMSALYNIGKSYLGKQIPISNGGLGGFILNNLEFKNNAFDPTRIQNTQLWYSYVGEFLFNNTRLIPFVKNKSYNLYNLTTVANPNRTYSILVIIWLLTFLILIGVLSLITVIQYYKDKEDKKQINAFVFVSSRKKRNIINYGKAKRILIIFAMFVMIILWTAFLTMLCMTQYLINSKLTNNNESDPRSYSSLNDAISISFTHLYSFFDVITNQTAFFINSSLSSMAIDIRSQLSTSMVEFGSKILITYNITDLFNTARTLMDSLNNVFVSMVYIENNSQNTLLTVNNTKELVSTYQNNLNTYLTNICSSLAGNQTLQNVCNSLLAKNRLFQTTIQTSVVSSSSSIILSALLRQYNINITAITTTFYKIDNNLKMRLQSLINDTVSKFDTHSYLALVTQVWDRLVGKLSPILDSTKFYNIKAASFLDSASKYENFMIIFMIFFIFFMILFVLLFSFRDSIQDGSLNRYFNFSIQLVFIVTLIFYALLSIGVMGASNFSQSEICNQVTTSKGIRVLDQMINEKLGVPWNTWKETVAPSIQNMTINLAQPKNILSGIKRRCKNQSVGIFSVFDMSNFFNVSQIIRSQTITNLISQGEFESFKSFTGINPVQIIPENLTSFFEQTLKFISYFDGINYDAGLQELQKPLVGIINFEEYFNDLYIFALNSSGTLGWTKDLLNLNNTVSILLSMAPNFTDTQLRVNSLAQNLQVLQDHRNNSSLLKTIIPILKGLKVSFENTTHLSSIFSTTYNQFMTINLLNTLDILVSGGLQVMVQRMIPCNDLSMIFEAMTTTLCSNTNFNVTLATFGVLLLLVTIICQIISVLVILSISLRLYSEKNVSKC